MLLPPSVLVDITVLHPNLGERGSMLPTLPDSRREREQKKREAGYEPSRLRDRFLVFPAVDSTSWSWSEE